jgi:dTDP-4-dehydrorhamnose reductase
VRLLILGGNGMLGHRLLRHLGPKHQVKVTLRENLEAYSHLGLFNDSNAFSRVDVRNTPDLLSVFADYSPDVVVNAVGLVKQRPIAKESIPSLEINALLPHRLSVLCSMTGARLIHFSTDCVFSGERGHYHERDSSDAIDLYGKSKFLGEVHGDGCLTLRTSIIGRELSRKTGLLEWILAQKGSVEGFKKAIYTGLSTLEVSRVIETVIVDHPETSGLFHLSSEPIDKFRLLVMIRDRFGLDVEIIPDESFVCDRSLDSTRFREAHSYKPPSWDAMVDELFLDSH